MSRIFYKNGIDGYSLRNSNTELKCTKISKAHIYVQISVEISKVKSHNEGALHLSWWYLF